mmetsp:Transcript_2875/g.4359  ORF Transcript_2875/g.4359 Transcript_2875/m.4359 type:complete len:97 (+) Transcript_2875:693-983(+)
MTPAAAIRATPITPATIPAMAEPLTAELLVLTALAVASPTVTPNWATQMPPRHVWPVVQHWLPHHGTEQHDWIGAPPQYFPAGQQLKPQHEPPLQE